MSHYKVIGQPGFNINGDLHTSIVREAPSLEAVLVKTRADHPGTHISAVYAVEYRGIVQYTRNCIFVGFEQPEE